MLAKQKHFFTAQTSTSDYPSLPPNTGGKGVSRMARSQIRKGRRSVANRFSPQFQEIGDVQTLYSAHLKNDYYKYSQTLIPCKEHDFVRILCSRVVRVMSGKWLNEPRTSLKVTSCHFKIFTSMGFQDLESCV